MAAVPRHAMPGLRPCRLRMHDSVGFSLVHSCQIHQKLRLLLIREVGLRSNQGQEDRASPFPLGFVRSKGTGLLCLSVQLKA